MLPWQGEQREYCSTKMVERHFPPHPNHIFTFIKLRTFSNPLARFRFPSLPELSGWLDGCGGPCPSHLPTLLHHQLLWLNQQQSPQTRFPTYNSQPVRDLVSLRVSAEQAPPTRKMAVEVISGVFDPRNYKVSVFCLVLFLSVFNLVLYADPVYIYNCSTRREIPTGQRKGKVSGFSFLVKRSSE